MMPGPAVASGAIAAQGWRRLQRAALLWPGLLLTSVLTLAAAFIAGHYGGPLALYALLLGMAFNALASDARFAPGVDFCARTILRAGIVLLGARVVASDVAALGAETAGLVLAAVAATLVIGSRLARWCGLSASHAWLSAGAVAICGASAALAISAVLPAQRDRDVHLSFTIAAATALSTVAMIAYPVLAAGFGLDGRSAGIFIGATIHDIAQVVAAGYTVSEEAGHAATVVKLMRVALLAPVVMALAWHFGRTRPRDARLRVGIPGFLVAFLLLALACMALPPPPVLLDAARTGSAACIALAVAATGVRTAPVGLLRLGLRPLAAMLLQSALLAAIVLAWLSVSAWP